MVWKMVMKVVDFYGGILCMSVCVCYTCVDEDNIVLDCYVSEKEYYRVYEEDNIVVSIDEINV